MSEGIGKALANAIRDEPVLAAEARGRHVFQNSNRRGVFTLLTENPCMGVGMLASITGLSKNSVKWHLEALVKAGYLVRFGAGRGNVFYPEGLISQETAGLFLVINSPRQSSLFRGIVARPGLSQRDIATIHGKSRQWVAASMKTLEQAGLVSGVADGAHTRYYPTRLLPDMADGFYRASKDFGDYMLKKLGREGGAAPAVVKHGLDRILVEVGHQSSRFNIEIGVNPYLTCLGCKI